MPLVPMTVRLSEDLHGQVEEHRAETGVPTAVFVRRAIKAALAAEPKPARKPARRPKPSTN